jgi:hypothetical protein
MSKIMLDDALRSKLNGLNESLVICDEAGQTVGHFLTAATYCRLLHQIAESQCPYSREELQALRQEAGGYPLADLWKTLGQS